MLTMITQADGSRTPTRPAVLAGGGHAGTRCLHPEAVIPRRRRPHTGLAEEDAEFNGTPSHDRMVVECFLGRLRRCWKTLRPPPRMDKANVYGLLGILVCLTSLETQGPPLIADESKCDPCPECPEDSGEASSEEQTGQALTLPPAPPSPQSRRTGSVTVNARYHAGQRARAGDGQTSPEWRTSSTAALGSPSVRPALASLVLALSLSNSSRANTGAHFVLGVGNLEQAK